MAKKKETTELAAPKKAAPKKAAPKKATTKKVEAINPVDLAIARLEKEAAERLAKYGLIKNKDGVIVPINVAS